MLGSENGGRERRRCSEKIKDVGHAREVRKKKQGEFIKNKNFNLLTT